MPLIANAEFPAPSDEKEFESLTRDLFASHWRDPDTTINGRRGQSQDGVDIYGRPSAGEDWFGIQCKMRAKSTLTRSDFEEECAKSRRFRNKLHTYIFATTLRRDTHLQKIIEDLDQIERKVSGTRVQIKFWEDISSLLAENVQIVRKYYPQFFYNDRAQDVVEINTAIEKSQVSPEDPMLVGVIIDVSRPLLNALKESHTFGNHDLEEALGLVAQKAIHYCKTPEGKEITPKFFLFAYGVGMANLRFKLNNILHRIGVQKQDSQQRSISNGNVRDLFGETAMRNSLPFTPNVSELNSNWNLYKESMVAQFLDSGIESPNLVECLLIVLERFQHEMQRTFYNSPILIIISSGHFESDRQKQLIEASGQIQALGVQMITCFVGSQNVAEPRKLYDRESKSWTTSASILFQIASAVTSKNPLLENIVAEARKLEWHIPEQAKWFIQLNQSRILDELTDIVLAPLRKF